MVQERQTWSSRVTYILTVAGATIGFGATWRFPYLVGQNGGGAYVLLFCICMIVIGIPMILVENVIGRRRQVNSVDAFGGSANGKTISPWWKIVAYMGLAGCFGIIAYYMVLGGWVFSYIFDIIRGALPIGHEVDAAFTSEFYDKSIAGSPWAITFYTALFVAVNWFILSKGIIDGIERSVRFLMPLLFLFLLVMVIRNVTLPGSLEGVIFYLKPDFSKITPQLFIFVLGQVFFALSLGFGVLITLSSYLSKEEDLVKTSIITAIINTLIAVMAGFMIFPGLFSFGLAPDSGPSLVFKTLPIVFSKMSFGAIFGVIFFCLLLVAALTTSVTLYEVLITALQEKTSLNRQASIAVVLIGTFIAGNIPSTFSSNIFDWFDFVSGNILFVLTALGTCLFTGFCLKDEAKKELSYCAGPTTVNIWFNYVKFVLPVIILVVFFYGLF
ncbi:sodium-dependent transporter [Psittacicella melopsittaci]|uniref:Transporter n=1 Tax=Psittacicella melopsittaci TaxID=2028576 RepID=A0A3A1Y9F4_9GAMM|nr:sodium-dependent transporter [Psittacicella melopsittaci]RIY33850.1 sodium-dependent transporter [Psittacicella melopsittaci]